MKKTLNSILVLAASALSLLANAHGQSVDPFVADFGSDWEQRWKVRNFTPSPAFRSEEAPRTLGFTTKEKTSLSREWLIGRAPFEMRWRVEIEHGTSQNWRFPGVVVALTTDPDADMNGNSKALAFAVMHQGIAAYPLQGELFEPNRNTEGHPPAYSNMTMHGLASRESKLNAAGANGVIRSKNWNREIIDGFGLDFVMTRNADDTVTFKAYHDGYENKARPWWEMTWELPENLRETAFSHIVIKTLHNPNDPVHRGKTSNASLPNLVLGKIRDLVARPLSVPEIVIDSVVPDSAVVEAGTSLRVAGANFPENARVSIDDQTADVPERSESGLRVIAPDLPSGQAYDLTVTHPNGYFVKLPDAVAYGRFLDRIEPYEALPRGGDPVTLIGAGFEAGTRILFNGREVRVIERIDARKAIVEVPAGEIGPAEVSAATGDTSFAGQPIFGYAPHPYLYFNESELTDLREKFELPAFADYKKLIIRNAERYSGDGAETEKSGIEGINDTLFAYLLTEDEKYREALLGIVERELRSIYHDEFALMRALEIANVYDALFSELTPELKTKMQAYMERAIAVYKSEVARNSWWYANNPSNTITIAASGAGLPALALIHSKPDAREVADIAVKKTKSRFWALQSDGSVVEGTLYWNYGVTPLLVLAHAYENTTGEPSGLFNKSGLANTKQFVQASLGGNDSMFAFNNTQPWLTGLAITADVGSRTSDPYLLWYSDYAAHKLANGFDRRENVRGDIIPYAFLWRSREPAPRTMPEIPLSVILDQVNWGVLRSNSAVHPDVVVGLKGRTGLTSHHYHNDLGSIVLHAYGEELLLDPGYGFGGAKFHNLPEINGKEPNGKEGKATLRLVADKGPWRVMEIDASDAYGTAERFKRIVVLHGNQSVVLLDDIVPAVGGPKAKVQSYFQAAGPVSVLDAASGAALVVGQSAKLGIQTLGAKVTLEVAGPLDFKDSWIYRKLAEQGDVSWHRLTASYTARPEDPLVTVLTPVPGDAVLKGAMFRRSADDTLSIELGDGTFVNFRREAGVWHWVDPE